MFCYYPFEHTRGVKKLAQDLTTGQEGANEQNLCHPNLCALLYWNPGTSLRPGFQQGIEMLLFLELIFHFRETTNKQTNSSRMP